MIRRILNLRFQAWQIAIVSMAGLLLAIAIAGLVGLGINEQVKTVTEQAIAIDVELEDRGDDFRVAVLDMRHYHRNITFAGPSRRGLANYDAAYRQLLLQIDRLADLDVDDPQLPSPDLLREMAETYYGEFRPAIELYEADQRAFSFASDDGLFRLSLLEDEARTIDQLGEARAAASLQSVEVSANRGGIVLLLVLGGLTLVGAGLTYLVIRTVRDQQRASTELANALQLKNDFIADASHELRTPLTVLRANAELAMSLSEGSDHSDLLHEIVEESDRMSSLVEDLLFLAGSDAGSAPLEPELTDIALLMTALAERASVLAREYSTDFQSKLFGTGLAMVDGPRIDQAILILVDNAGKYSPPGGQTTLATFNQGDRFVIEVRDHGIGIPEEQLPFVFERFYRVDKSRSRRQGGTGLGLAIARSIVEAHNGRIEAESTVGVGTTMRIILPLVKPELNIRRRSEPRVAPRSV